MSLELSHAPARTGLVRQVSGLIYGADYSPEQWPEDVWEEDARLMHKAGVNLVSLGVFAWSSIQLGPSTFEFGWLDRVIDLLHAQGVAVNLATPTAAPPPWLVRRHPEILPVTEEGVTLGPGSRRHYCPHSTAYRDAAATIARMLAERYRDHPALAMWHVDNEYACHITECFCDRSAVAFREWLRRRYQTPEALNAAWGTAFWSQSYGDWDEVQPPRRAPSFLNPSHVLDWRRFCSDSWLACFRDQSAILREVTPGVPVTTNFMGFHGPLDYWTWAREEDVVSNDSYPDPADAEWMVGSALTSDLIRSLGEGRPWILMEQASAHVNWRQRNATKRPGVMRLGSFQALARGADGVMFFQWRASQAGAEQHHSAMLPHGGTSTRMWRETSALGEELKLSAELAGSRVISDAAILYDWENAWALESGPLPSNAVRLLPQVRSFYSALFRRGLTVDLAHPASDLTGYRLVVAPSLYLTTDAAAENLARYVEHGGTLLVTFFSGIVDANDQVRLGAAYQPFHRLLGVEVEEFAPLEDGGVARVSSDEGGFDGSLWVDVIRLDGAEPLAWFADDYYASRPAVTRHRFGLGTALYSGTLPDASGLDWLVGRACEAAGITGDTAPSGIEKVRRSDGVREWLFVLNHTEEGVEVPVGRGGVDILTGAAVDASVQLGPLGVAIVRRETTDRAGGLAGS
jgi:beta-galactosidase